jgi:ribosomal protein S18 acetylase RimI-like enzyme
MIDDDELARRSVLGFGETIAALGGATRAVRRADALGARIDDARDNHWLDAAVVPYGATPPDDADLPHALWTVAESAPGRAEKPSIAMPCLGIELASAALDDGERDPEPPPLSVVGEVNDRAYGQLEALGPLLVALDGDARVGVHGIRVDRAWACVALTLRFGDDASVQYVATEERFRRRGLASRLLRAALARERDAGAATATLQASPDGLAVYERLGFRRVALLNAFLR